jgi:hypothetical protein
MLEVCRAEIRTCRIQNDERGKLRFARQDDGQAAATITDQLELIFLHEIRPEKLDLDLQSPQGVKKRAFEKLLVNAGKTLPPTAESANGQAASQNETNAEN